MTYLEGLIEGMAIGFALAPIIWASIPFLVDRWHLVLARRRHDDR